MRRVVERAALIAAMLLSAHCGEHTPPSPPPVTAPSVAPAPPAAEPLALPRVLAWRYGTFERPSILLATPLFPITPEEALPAPWRVYLSHMHRLALVLDSAQARDYVAPHSPDMAHGSLRRDLGDDDFAALVARFSVHIATDPSVLDRTDPTFAGLFLTLLELGYEDSNDDVNTRLARWAEFHDLPATSLLDAATYRRLADPPRALAVDALRETVAEPERVSAWMARARAAYSSADPEAMALACDEPERRAAWDDDARRRRTALAEALAEPVRAALEGEPTLVAIDACLLVGEGRLLSLLAARGVALTPLHETE